MRSLAKSAVIGKTVADQLFPNENPLGQTIRIRNLPFQIVGVLAAKGFNLFGQDQDDVVIVPYTSHMHRITTRTFLNSILVQAASDKTISQVQQEITDLLLARHRSKEPDFTVRSQLELMQAVTATSRAMGISAGGVAAVSLVVGGIGIMNIMLVSVTERTREIGIRMAVGARGGGHPGAIFDRSRHVERDWRRDRHRAAALAFSRLVAYLKDMADVTPVIWIVIAVRFQRASSASSPVFIPRGKRPSSTRLTRCATNNRKRSTFNIQIRHSRTPKSDALRLMLNVER